MNTYPSKSFYWFSVSFNSYHRKGPWKPCSSLSRKKSADIDLAHSFMFCIFVSATYNLSIKVGDVKGSGTDGNVYIQLFGEKSNTAKIQLRQAGDVRNRFEKGRTYKFTVDTTDIGKVCTFLDPTVFCPVYSTTGLSPPPHFVTSVTSSWVYSYLQ